MAIEQTKRSDARSRGHAVDAILNKQCTGMWRLTSTGSWQMLHGESNAAARQIAGIMELFASTCWATFAPGAKFSARIGPGIVSGQVDERGVLVGFNIEGGNPVVLRTAMDRLVARSERSDAVVSSRASRLEWSTGPSEDPTSGRGFGDTLAFSDGSSSDSDSRRGNASVEIMSEPSESGVDSVPPTVGDPAEASSEAGRSDAQSPPETSAAEAARPDPGVEFEIVFSQPGAEAPESSRASSSRRCTWGEVAGHVEALLEQSAEFIGRTVAANYWRESIANSDLVVEHLRVDALGSVEVRDPDAQVQPECAEALHEVQRAWVDRCTRVIPDVARSLPGLGTEPWIHAAMQQGVNR
jgi:hypothetical protein